MDDEYSQLASFTLELRDEYFVHQLAVDAYAAQNYEPHKDSPIKITFALIGLYLANEKKYTGKQVQKAHMELGNKKRNWPAWTQPEAKAELAIKDVLAAANEDKTEMIKKWNEAVWNTWKGKKNEIEAILASCGYL